MAAVLHRTGNGLIVEGPAQYATLPLCTEAAQVMIGPHALHELIRDRYGIDVAGQLGRLRITIEQVDHE